jgi:hypothetical protein
MPDTRTALESSPEALRRGFGGPKHAHRSSSLSRAYNPCAPLVRPAPFRTGQPNGWAPSMLWGRFPLNGAPDHILTHSAIGQSQL